MHSSSPSLGEEQLELFGISPQRAPGLAGSTESPEALSETEPPDASGARVLSRIRDTQIALQLPQVALNDLEWSDEQLCALREGVLRAHLHLLKDERTTAELRAEIIEWIATPKRKVDDLRREPFSFQACCLAVGVDFEEMRERTLYLVAPDLIERLD